MDACDESLLQDLLDGRLDANAARELEQRLAHDVDLREIHEDLLRIRRLIRGDPDLRVPEGFLEGVRSRIAALPAEDVRPLSVLRDDESGPLSASPDTPDAPAGGEGPRWSLHLVMGSLAAAAAVLLVSLVAWRAGTLSPSEPLAVERAATPTPPPVHMSEARSAPGPRPEMDVDAELETVSIRDVSSLRDKSGRARAGGLAARARGDQAAPPGRRTAARVPPSQPVVPPGSTPHFGPRDQVVPGLREPFDPPAPDVASRAASPRPTTAPTAPAAPVPPREPAKPPVGPSPRAGRPVAADDLASAAPEATYEIEASSFDLGRARLALLIQSLSDADESASRQKGELRLCREPALKDGKSRPTAEGSTGEARSSGGGPLAGSGAATPEAEFLGTVVVVVSREVAQRLYRLVGPGPGGASLPEPARVREEFRRGAKEEQPESESAARDRGEPRSQRVAVPVRVVRRR